jgi:3-hydroxyacyl-CoA dehydrogenase/enoyl-CoA hydratase/3-hydroxybutyryl-CoA epimerase
MINKHIKYSIDNDGNAVVTWDVVDSPVNIMNEATMAEFFSTINQAIADDVVKELLLPAKKKDFIAGGDLKWF